MIFAYALEAGRLVPLLPEADLTRAIWIDLYRPLPVQVERVAALGLSVPTLEEMEEIEISNRLYLEDGAAYLTAVLPGLTPDGVHVAVPVTFILSPGHLVTVRHHAPRSFETFATRAQRSAAGCGTSDRTFLGLIEEIVGRQADLLEGVGKALDKTAAVVFGSETPGADALSAALAGIGREGEMLARVRLGLLTLERVLGYYRQLLDKHDDKEVRSIVTSTTRDIQSLEVHADFIGNRVGLITDATLGLINLSQNGTVRIISVVAALFLPPTLIASIYGMNFADMPELNSPLGYPLALGAMVASALATYLYFKWKRWL